MTLEAKITALQSDPGDESATLTVQVYDTDAPQVVLFTGPLTARLDWPPERLQNALDALLDRIEARRQNLGWLQNLVGKPQRRRP